MQVSERSRLGGDDAVALTLKANVGIRNDTRGPFAMNVPFVYDSSLRVSGSVHTPLSYQLVAPLF